MKRLPPIATVLVIAAVAVMMSLGFWQIGRAQEKEAALAQFEAAAGLPPVSLPSAATPPDALPLFRRTSATCRDPGTSRTLAGRNRQGVSGFVHWVECEGFRADIGWSPRPASVRWKGGPISGVISPDRTSGFRLVSDRGFAGLQASAPPNVADIPNNHRSYAFQWFAFATAALVIFGLALRGRGGRAQ